MYHPFLGPNEDIQLSVRDEAVEGWKAELKALPGLTLGERECSSNLSGGSPPAKDKFRAAACRPCKPFTYPWTLLDVLTNKGKNMDSAEKAKAETIKSDFEEVWERMVSIILRPGWESSPEPEADPKPKVYKTMWTGKSLANKPTQSASKFTGTSMCFSSTKYSSASDSDSDSVPARKLTSASSSSSSSSELNSSPCFVVPTLVLIFKFPCSLVGMCNGIHLQRNIGSCGQFQ
ncbi:hypothetical protein K474DRAFT_1774483 [Panus rudis PR-1116 ss-1]|nr:hypothetical protein K474DRAFT_1774483 [Panus rudis PR-1116 ss-1]